MRKKIIAYILLAGMLFSAPATAHAESLTSERNVSFTSENKLSTDYESGDVDSEVHNLQPGDDITITLNLKNDNPSASNWYMTNEVMQSLEETAGSNASGGAYEYELVYTDPTGAREVLFTSDTVGGENNGSRVGLKAATSGLEDFLYLDTLAPGEQGIITLRVALDGETEGNSYQNTLARLQMNFAVDTTVVNNQTITEVVDEEGNPIVVEEDGSPESPGTAPDGSSSRGTGIVRTGDENNLLPFIMAAAVSGILLLFLAIFGVKERRKQKGAGKILTIVMALCLAGGMSRTVQASGEGYTYTLRLYAGAQGAIDASVVQRLADAGAQVSIENGEVCVVSGLHYGTQVVFDIQRGVTLNNNSKYYCKGFRISGEDNSTGSLATPSVTVSGDQDFVVAYGIQGETVAYTVNYVDQDGNELFPSAVYYGNVGDKPVVAYQYVEGWQPQAYNLGKTLVADASQNVFTFVYSPIPTVVNTETVVVPGQPAEPQPPIVIPASPQPPVEQPEPGTEGEETDPGAPVEIAENEIPATEPDEYRDLDEDETPMGNYGDGTDGDGNGDSGSGNALTQIIDDLATPLALLPTPVKAGIAVAVTLMAGAVIWLLAVVHRKRKKNDGE